MNCFGMRAPVLRAAGNGPSFTWRRSKSSLKNEMLIAPRPPPPPWYERRSRRLHRVGVLAADRRIHVGKGAARIRLPGPDMQFVEGRQAVAIRGAGEVEELPVQRSRPLGRDVFDRDQLHFAVRLRLVHDRLRLLDVDGLADQRSLDVMYAHGAAVGPAGAGDGRIALGDGDRDIPETVIGGTYLQSKRIVVRDDGGHAGSNCKQ